MQDIEGTPERQTGEGKIKLCRTMRSIWALAIGLGVLAALMFFVLMPQYPMQNWDEGIHSQVTREMMQGGDWWTLHYQGELYFRKPPIKMWLTAPLVLLFGDHTWVYRFWSAIAGIASAVLLGILIFRKEKNILAAWLSGFIFISGQFIFYHAFRTGETDGLFLLFLVFGFFAYWKGLTKPKWLIAMGASFGLSVMTKSLAGLIGPFVVILDVLLRRDWKMLRSRYIWYGVTAFFVIALPWHLSMIAMYGHRFWDEYVGFHIVERAFTELYADLPWYWYIKIIIQRLFPLSFFFIGALLVPVVDMIRRKKIEASLALLWLGVPLLLFTLVKTKFEWYILPAYPAAAWLIGRYLADVIRQYKRPLLYITFAISVFLVFAWVPSAIPPGAKTYWFTLQAYIPHGLVDAVQNSYVWSALFVLVLCILWSALRKKRERLIPVLFSLFILHSLGFAFGRNAGIIVTEPRASIYQDIAQVAASEHAEQVVTYNTDFYNKPAAYYEMYSVTPTIIDVPSIADVRKLFNPQTIVITSQDKVPKNTTLLTHIDQYYIYGEAK